nr:PREDICTED: small integral membrane protein 19-like [Saccoglossus kowalevskii]
MWNDATNIYIVVILLSFLLIWYFKKNKRKLLALLPYKFRTRDSLYADTTEKDEELKRVRLRQQLEMYYKTRKYESGQMPPPGQFNNGETVAVNIT